MSIVRIHRVSIDQVNIRRNFIIRIVWHSRWTFLGNFVVVILLWRVELLEAEGWADVCIDAALLAALSAAKALKNSTRALTKSERMGS